VSVMPFDFFFLINSICIFFIVNRDSFVLIMWYAWLCAFWQLCFNNVRLMHSFCDISYINCLHQKLEMFFFFFFNLRYPSQLTRTTTYPRTNWKKLEMLISQKENLITMEEKNHPQILLYYRLSPCFLKIYFFLIKIYFFICFESFW
jgi:hypothetical protein